MGKPVQIPGPTPLSKSVHHSIVGSAAQMRRVVAGGSLEADIEFLNRKFTDEERRKRDVRHRLEDIKMARELGIDEVA